MKKLSYTIASTLYITCLIFAQPEFINYHYDRINYLNDFVFYNDSIWCATDEGVVVFDMSFNKIAQFTTDDGLPESVIDKIFIDSTGHKWVAIMGCKMCEYNGRQWKTYALDLS